MNSYPGPVGTWVEPGGPGKEILLASAMGPVNWGSPSCCNEDGVVT